jgi:pilus assembly protein CpaF
MRQYVAAGIKLVVQLARLKGGVRKVVRISEIVGVKQDDYQVEEIFGFEQMGVDVQGRARGEYYATGYVPQCLRRIRAAGIEVNERDFLAQHWTDQSALPIIESALENDRARLGSFDLRAGAPGQDREVLA